MQPILASVLTVLTTASVTWAASHFFYSRRIRRMNEFVVDMVRDNNVKAIELEIERVTDFKKNLELTVLKLRKNKTKEGKDLLEETESTINALEHNLIELNKNLKEVLIFFKAA